MLAISSQAQFKTVLLIRKKNSLDQLFETALPPSSSLSARKGTWETWKHLNFPQSCRDRAIFKNVEVKTCLAVALPPFPNKISMGKTKICQDHHDWRSFNLSCRLTCRATTLTKLENVLWGLSLASSRLMPVAKAAPMNTKWSRRKRIITAELPTQSNNLKSSVPNWQSRTELWTATN